MYISTFTGNFACITRLWKSGNQIASLRAICFSRCMALLAIFFFSFAVLIPEGYAQGKKNKEKQGMVKVKSNAFKRKKQRETTSFTDGGYNRGGAERNKRNTQKQSSSFIGDGIRITKNTKNPTTDYAPAYKQIKSPKLGRNPMGEQIARKSSAGQGNGLVKSQYKKEKEARRMSGKMSSFKGNKGGLVKSQYKKEKEARKKSKQMSRYRGDLIVKKRPKGAHPSAAYRGGKVKNSYQQKEKYRKRMLKRMGRNKKAQQPNYLRKKNRDEKPTYDSRESDIWLKPR